MRLALPIVRSGRHRRHGPGEEVWIGVRTPGAEVPRRAAAIRDALRAEGARFVDAERHPDADVRPDPTTIGAPVAETLAGVQEGMSRA